ncbi:unnamed protein product [Moneuplotes crassus]|uniref:Uncharacterized protein n=1 Tax=Euplotes crassus TaxID=5936 RepID=A0AAD1XHZ2_EUPCR|nr:unnamed protein product [Moneuplotes crassus]
MEVKAEVVEKLQKLIHMYNQAKELTKIQPKLKDETKLQEFKEEVKEFSFGINQTPALPVEPKELTKAELKKLDSSILYTEANEAIKEAQKLSNKVESGENIIFKDSFSDLKSEITQRKEINQCLQNIIKDLQDKLVEKKDKTNKLNEKITQKKQEIKDLEENFEELKTRKENEIAQEASKAHVMKQEIFKFKRKIDFKDQQSRLTYYLTEKLSENTARIYSEQRKKEITEQLITEGIELLEAKIQEEEDKYQNIDSIVNPVQQRIEELLQKESEFMEQYTKEHQGIGRSDSDTE